jgi:hypothetical protein
MARRLLARFHSILRSVAWKKGEIDLAALGEQLRARRDEFYDEIDAIGGGMQQLEIEQPAGQEIVEMPAPSRTGNRE